MGLTAVVVALVVGLLQGQPDPFDVPEIRAQAKLGAEVLLTLSDPPSTSEEPELLSAIKSGDSAKVKDLLKGGSPTAWNGAFEPAILVSIRSYKGDLSILRALLDSGVSATEFPQGAKATPLQEALFYGERMVAEELISRNATPLTMGGSGEDLLSACRFCAMARDDAKSPIYSLLLPPYAEAALAEGDKREFASSCGITGLMAECFLGREEDVRKALDGGADPMAKDGAGWTAAHWAASSDHSRAAILRLLSAHGASFNKADKAGQTPLSVAAAAGIVENLKVILDARQADDNGSVSMALIRAAIYGHRDGAELLLSTKHADSWAIQLAAMRAVRRSDSKLLSLMIDHGAAMDPEKGPSLLAGATAMGDVESMRMLLARGAKIANNTSAGSALAAARDRRDLFELLLDSARQNGKLQDPVFKGRVVDVALVFASRRGYLDICKTLLAEGADVAFVLPPGVTALTAACGNNHLDVAKLLVEHGAKADLEVMGQTALMEASRAGSAEIIKFLVASGADPRAGLRNGTSPLATAIDAGKGAAIRALVESGAELTSTDPSRDWLDRAIMAHQPESVRVLLELHVPLRLPAPNENDAGFPGKRSHLWLAKYLASDPHAHGDSGKRVLDLIQAATDEQLRAGEK
jgi:ankyrin repeat protein